MQLPTPGFLLTAFLQVCRRFPGAMLCSFLGTAACIMLIDSNGSKEGADFVVRCWLACQLGLPLLTALVAYSESKGWGERRGWMAQILGVAALIGGWFWLDTLAANFETQILPQFLALLLVMHLAVSVAPYLNQRSVRDFWEYNRELFANLIVGAAFTLILFVGLALALLAVDNLFNFRIPDRAYPKLFLVLAGVFNTAYFLYHFPQKYSALPAVALAPAEPWRAGAEEGAQPPPKSDNTAYNWVFRNLCKYILIPIVLLYFVILYAYGAKIGIQWSLPKGWVSSLVLGFSAR